MFRGTAFTNNTCSSSSSSSSKMQCFLQLNNINYSSNSMCFLLLCHREVFFLVVMLKFLY